MLFTADHENGVIEEGAPLKNFESFDSAHRALSMGLGSDAYIVEWQEGYFSDCWIKSYEAPELDEDGLAEHDGIKCRVRNPGQHPGGNCWWLEPAETVYCPMIEINEDEE